MERAREERGGVSVPARAGVVEGVGEGGGILGSVRQPP
ncbi:Hypothetical protein CAP_0350 [Chondromyces apiculatus DSM 436]|uniref:Uncharacterized protein n=1 Tax=Chondromyces apiculatus DSM 436 TaxID=1192034 RepID=A0A017SUL9_9BACT|nr:Hypothetical protein CAP_0350 [Chondromyces apiculatus DSM 436]